MLLRSRNDAPQCKMDPQQTAVYAKAHDDLQDLFHEIARHGRVSALELQHALLPFTAGDAKRDLQELIDDMRRKQTSLDEPDFIRVLWKKMYLSNVVYTTQHTGDHGGRAGAADGEEPAINIPLAHVIVSIKRRAQLKQFASYYASRGISGADHLDADRGTDRSHSDVRLPRHLVQAQKKRQAAAVAASQAATITMLRDRKTTGSQDVVLCFYDSHELCMKTRKILEDVPEASVTNCSRLHCLISSKQTGLLVVGHRRFIDQVRARANRLHDQQHNDSERPGVIVEPTGQSTVSLADDVPDLTITKLDDLGLRNIVHLSVGRGKVVATTERRVHYWHAFATPKPTASSPEASVKTSNSLSSPAGKQGPTLPAEVKLPMEMIEFLEDEGDCFGHVPLLKRVKTVSDITGIRQVACGDRFVMGLTASSDLYAWGTASLGRGKAAPTKVPFFSMADPPIAVNRICCGLSHVVALTAQRTLHTWGSNVHGQLGLGPQCSVLDAAIQEPVEVKLPSPVLDVACGDHHTIALTDKGGVMAWGNNWYGQLGLDPSTTETGCVYTPMRVSWWLSRSTVDVQSTVNESASPPKSSQPPPERAYLITAMGDTTAIVTEQGCVYTWGKCIPSDAFAAACGIISTWIPQRVETPDDDDASSHAPEADAAASSVSPWTGLTIASGLVVLTKKSRNADASPASATKQPVSPKKR